MFLLVGVPCVGRSEQLDWLQRSAAFAFECGASVVSLIPTRPGNGPLGELARIGAFETPSIVDLERAMQGDPAVIHPDFANNLAVPYVPGGTGVDAVAGTVDNSAVDKAFEQAEVVISQRMMNQRLAPNAMEPRGVVAHYEPGKDSMTIWSSTQNPHILRTMIAAMTGMGQDRVRAIAPEVTMTTSSPWALIRNSP